MSAVEGRVLGSPAEAIEQALAAGDVERAKRTVSVWAERLRGGAGSSAADGDGLEEQSLFTETLFTLKSHPSFGIREAVAKAADLLPDGAFDLVLAALERDDDNFVRVAIGAAAKRRATRKKAKARKTAEEKVLADLLAEIEAKHGKAARRLADRAVRRGTEYFVRSLHHEATKIMTPLKQSLSSLRSEVARPELDRAAPLRHVEIAWERQSHLWAVLDRAREVTATRAPTFRNERLVPLLEEARGHLAVRLGTRAERLAFVSEVDPALRLDVDRSALLQALHNFFQNAVEAYPADAPRLEIAVSASLARAGSLVEIGVADRAGGMSEAQRAMLFTPFASHKPGGTGVGLLIARTMVEEVHGGTLRLESTPGEGTRVALVLPARQSGRVPRA